MPHMHPVLSIEAAETARREAETQRNAALAEARAAGDREDRGR